MRFEVRHRQPEILSGVTKTEQTNVRGTAAWRACPALGEFFISCPASFGVRDAGAIEGLLVVMAKAWRTIGHGSN